MSLDRALTVILPVRGRLDYTLRWLRWLEASGLPCRVIVADGSEAADAAAAARAVAAGAAKGLPWAHRIPDQARAGILARVTDAAAAVETPYAALAANDDFPLAAGLAACAAALDARPDAAACGGPAMAIALPADEPVWSKRASARPPAARAAFSAGTALSRVEDILDTYDPLWYDVQRTGVMRDAFVRIERSGLRDLNLSELLHAAAVAAAGPVLRASVPHLARQEDAASSASAEIAGRGDLLSEILSDGWGAQFEAFIAAAADAAGDPQARPRVRAAYARYARAALARTPGFGGGLPLRRRVAAAVKSALGERAVSALRRARPAPSFPVPDELAPVLAFLASGPSGGGR
ncbi:MAG: TIGR00180 family glycosyltransferase [Elusimicrobiota bacterium]|nr:TIGR00180 family glycosyltransferase [Elusimicrobiota bacterium]